MPDLKELASLDTKKEDEILHTLAGLWRSVQPDAPYFVSEAKSTIVSDKTVEPTYVLLNLITPK